MSIIIHVGMSKAASTSIQNITNTHQDFYYFGKHAKIDSKSNNRYSSAESAYLTRSIINLEKFNFHIYYK